MCQDSQADSDCVVPAAALYTTISSIENALYVLLYGRHHSASIDIYNCSLLPCSCRSFILILRGARPVILVDVCVLHALFQGFWWSNKAVPRIFLSVSPAKKFKFHSGEKILYWKNYSVARTGNELCNSPLDIDFYFTAGQLIRWKKLSLNNLFICIFYHLPVCHRLPKLNNRMFFHTDITDLDWTMVL